MGEVAADRIQLEFVKSNGCAGICGQAETIRIESARSVVAVHSPLPHPVLSQRVYSWLGSHGTSSDRVECPPTKLRLLESLGNHH